MSVTTTENPIHYTLQATLADYDLHHTGEHDTSVNSHPNPAANAQQNPSNWPVDYRRTPAYRPINHELDQSERRVYLHAGERVFVFAMFTGVLLQSVSFFGADRCRS